MPGGRRRHRLGMEPDDGSEALEGIDVGVSSWTRLAPNTLPALAKGAANYANSALIKMQAMLDGYADAVALDESGLLSEGSGQNLFLVRDNVIFTPSLGSSVLQGITRDTVMVLAMISASSCVKRPFHVSSCTPTRRFLRGGGDCPVTRTFDKIQVGNGGAGRSPRRCSGGFSQFCAAITRTPMAGSPL